MEKTKQLVMPFVSLTAFPINVGVKFSLKEAIFDLGGLFVVGNIQEGVGLGTQRSAVSGIFLHKHGAPQLSFVTAHADIKNMFKKNEAIVQKYSAQHRTPSLTLPTPAGHSLWNYKDPETKSKAPF